MLKTVETSRATKTKGVAVTYRAGSGEKFATCPADCKMNCSGKGSAEIDHDYLDALLDAVPKFEVEKELRSIEGNVPNLVTPPSGCRFHPRCRHAMDVCRKEFPEMKEVRRDHLVACYWATK